MKWDRWATCPHPLCTVALGTKSHFSDHIRCLSNWLHITCPQSHLMPTWCKIPCTRNELWAMTLYSFSILSVLGVGSLFIIHSFLVFLFSTRFMLGISLNSSQHLAWFLEAFFLRAEFYSLVFLPESVFADKLQSTALHLTEVMLLRSTFLHAHTQTCWKWIHLILRVPQSFCVWATLSHHPVSWWLADAPDICFSCPHKDVSVTQHAPSHSPCLWQCNSLDWAELTENLRVWG